MTFECVSIWMLSKAGKVKFAGVRENSKGVVACVLLESGVWALKEKPGTRGSVIARATAIL